MQKKQTSNNLDLYVIHLGAPVENNIDVNDTRRHTKKAIGISYVLESCWFKNTNGQLSKQKKHTRTRSETFDFRFIISIFRWIDLA